MRCFERRFVGNYRVVEIVREPRDSGFEAQHVKRSHADTGAVRGVNSGVHTLPKQPEVFARSDDFRAMAAKMSAANKMRGNTVYGNLCVSKFRKTFQREPASLRDDGAGLRSFHRKTAELVREVFERDVIHDDVFIERGESALAHRSVRTHEQFFGERIHLQFSEDVPLRIQQERARAIGFADGFNVVGHDCVQVADAVGAGKRKDGVPVSVEYRSRFFCRAIFGREI